MLRQKDTHCIANGDKVNSKASKIWQEQHSNNKQPWCMVDGPRFLREPSLTFVQERCLSMCPTMGTFYRSYDTTAHDAAAHFP